MIFRHLFRLAFLWFWFLLSASCARNVHQGAHDSEPVIYPPPPDTTRIQFLTHYSSSADITGQVSSFRKFILGETPATPIVKPYGISIHEGRIFICDSGSGEIEIINLENQTFENFSPKGFGKLKLPLNCFSDDLGNLYIADVGRGQVVMFDKEGKYVDGFGEKEDFKPTDVFAKGDRIYVTNAKQNQVVVFDRESHKPAASFPESETGNDDFLYSPTNLWVTDDYVYVSDMGDFKVKIYSLDGKFIKSIGSYGRNIGQFARPKGIAVDKKNLLYVVDAGFENVQIFDEKGNILMFFGGPYKGPGDMWLPAKVIVDYDNIRYFEKYVDPRFSLKYIILVTNQYGPDKINVYGFVEPKK